MNSNKIQDLLTQAKIQVMGINIATDNPKTNKALDELNRILNEINFEITKAAFQADPNKFHLLED